MAAAARRPKRRYKSAGGSAVCGLESGAGRGSAPWIDRNQGGCKDENGSFEEEEEEEEEEKKKNEERIS